MNKSLGACHICQTIYWQLASYYALLLLIQLDAPKGQASDGI